VENVIVVRDQGLRARQYPRRIPFGGDGRHFTRCALPGCRWCTRYPTPHQASGQAREARRRWHTDHTSPAPKYQPLRGSLCLPPAATRRSSTCAPATRRCRRSGRGQE
jgi:hypothetical protein